MQTTKQDPAGEYLDYLEQAIMHKAENSNMPRVGGALFRRTLQTVNVSMGDKQVRAYYCFICNERHVHLAPFHHRDYARLRGAVEKVSWLHLRNVMGGWYRESKDEFNKKWYANLDFDTFAKRYAAGWKHGQPGTRCEGEHEHGFVYDSWEWKRRLLLGETMTGTSRIGFCCPEDIDASSRQCKKLHGHDKNVLCFHCKVPVCLECYSRLWDLLCILLTQ